MPDSDVLMSPSAVLTARKDGHLALAAPPPVMWGSFSHLAAVDELVQCATLFCTYPTVAAKAAFARVTLARMSLALAVQMNGLGSML